MARKVLLVVSGILLSMLLSALLGELALRTSPFGRMVRELKENPQAPATDTFQYRYGNPLGVTIRMERLTDFVLDPIVAVLVGLLMGIFGRKEAGWLGAIGVLPLAVFAAFPLRWEGLAAMTLDLLIAFGAAGFVSRRVSPS